MYYNRYSGGFSGIVKLLSKSGFSNLLGLFRPNKGGFSSFIELFRFSSNGFSNITGLFGFGESGFSGISKDGGFIGLFKLPKLLKPPGKGGFRGPLGLLEPFRLPSSLF